jgi:hypothetical protein
LILLQNYYLFLTTFDIATELLFILKLLKTFDITTELLFILKLLKTFDITTELLFILKLISFNIYYFVILFY